MPPSPKPRAGVGAAAQPLAGALRASEPLASLLRRLRESESRWAVIVPLLPVELAGAARAGPLDDRAWTVLADHAAAAAKLRQLVPLIEQRLLAEGFAAAPVRIKVVPRA